MFINTGYTSQDNARTRPTLTTLIQSSNPDPKSETGIARAFSHPTERVEAAGFVFPGDNSANHDEVIRRINAVHKGIPSPKGNELVVD